MNWLSLILILTAESEGENKTVLLYCLSLSKEFGNIDGFKIFKTIVTHLTILLQWIRIVLIKMEIAVPCAFQRLLDISAHVQMEWIWKTNLRVHKVKYTLAIANLTNYTFNWFEFFFKENCDFYFYRENLNLFLKKNVFIVNCNLKKQTNRISLMCTWDIKLYILYKFRR